MTVTLFVDNPSIGNTAPASEVFPEDSCKPNHNNGQRRLKCGKLKTVQIILGVLVLVLIRPRFRDANIEYIQMFVTCNATLLTTVLLWDKVRRSLEWDRVCDGKLELYYTGVVAVLYYSASFGMLACYIGYYNPRTNIEAGLVGMLASFAYGYNWWLLYREQVLSRLRIDCAEETNRSRQKEQELV
ncbi:uncharacterized protein LOC131689564 [Topomyia yanbarensis]|uniref:uncharacterized protein LOC131689564 n=1 Tax=Topomyia yanbarensis TaxID=2498891 RepID=UPI00273BB764|nr:uncharacterized protein LOC131689564 [Topomyia yanbarensis]